MYIREKPLYASFQELWERGYRSPYFSALQGDASPQEDLSLSERLLFTQSNGQTLLGQDTKGQLHFICSPDSKDYAIPSGGPRVHGQFSGHIGQYYQADLAMLLGKLRYQIHLENGLVQDAASEDARTWYVDHFLPMTESVRPHMTTRVFSIAPVLEEESKARSPLHPLPGPCGAIFGLVVENTGTAPLRGILKLRMDQEFVIDNEEYGMVFEEASVRPYQAEWDRKLLTLWRPDAYATLQLLGAQTSGDADHPQIHLPFSLDVGQSQVFSCIVTVAPEKRSAHAALGILYQHTTLEWINITAGFWRKRLGTLSLGMDQDAAMGQKYRDMHIRFILDDFNCLMFGEDGRMLANWQGAPSHGLCRLWGIDIEPTVLSVLYAIPEIGPSAVRYMLHRSEPRYSIYSDHSVPIYVAPLIMAGKYLELTGDVDLFREDAEMMRGLHAHVERLMEFKHKDKALFSSRYASDLIVFRKYDYSTNVKCFYALRLYAEILRALEQDAGAIDALLAQMKIDLAQVMEGDGPFGPQITGGSNLGESAQERFYIPEEIYYYGGEDSSTCMAPLYGLYEFDYAPWVNLHRYARSLFITNYDPEYQSMRELHYGMNPSATGNILRIGGSVTCKEMQDSLDVLFDRLDVSGSLFWWPRSVNKRRCLTRCNQGQGSWVQQSVEQWLGLRMDGLGHVLTLRPQGLVDQIHAQRLRIGSFVFDLDWEEHETEVLVRVANHNSLPFTVRVGLRAHGSGAQGTLSYHEIEVAPGESISNTFEPVPAPQAQEPMLTRRECELLAQDGAVFGPYGLALPKLHGGECDVFLLRYAVVNGTEAPWKDVRVELELPPEWKAAQKEFFVWEYLPQFGNHTLSISMGDVAPFEHRVAGFYVLLPKRMAGQHNVLLSKHPFMVPSTDTTPVVLHIGAQAPEENVPAITATLWAGEKSYVHTLPVQVHGPEAFARLFDEMIHGE